MVWLHLSDVIKQCTQSGRHIDPLQEVIVLFHIGLALLASQHFLWIQHTLGVLCHYTYEQKTCTKHSNITLKNDLLQISVMNVLECSFAYM